MRSHAYWERMPVRFFEALDDIAEGRIRRDAHYHYRRNHGMGRICDTVIYTLEDRGMVSLLADGTLSLRTLGLEVLQEKKQREANGELPQHREEEVDADHR